MKFISKIWRICSLILVVVTCNGAEKGQQINFFITNKMFNKKTVYGTVYETNAEGKVTEENPTYYALPYQSCLEVAKYKPTALKGQMSQYHRVIFATTEQALKNKVLNNKNSNDADSTVIAPSHSQNDKAASACYSIDSVGTKKSLKIAFERCISCGGNYQRMRELKIKDI